MMSAHVSAEAGEAPSCASDARPEKPTTCPTRQRVVAAGVSITGVGGVLPTLMATVETSLNPPLSVTRRLTVTTVAALAL